MKRTRFNNWPCPIARTIDRIGDAWTPIILRNATWGPIRFDETQRALGIPRATFADRLERLVDEGILDQVEYQATPQRFEYHLTDRGRDLWPVMATMWQWGSNYGWPEPKVPPFVMVDAESGAPVVPIVVDANTGKPLTVQGVRVVPNPDRPDARGQWPGPNSEFSESPKELT